MTLLFSLLFACAEGAGSGAPESQPGTTKPDGNATAEAVGDCKGTPDGPIVDTAGYTPTFSMTAESDRSLVTLHLVDVVANCCPSPGASYRIEGSTLRVDFTDVPLDTSCDCSCVFDFDVALTSVPNGSYTVDLYQEGNLLGSAPVTVSYEVL